MSYKDLHENNLQYEGLICGSDQIWNPDYNIPSFFLDFGSDECKKVIYAASIGKSKLKRNEKKVYKKLLVSPDYISVREKTAQKLISNLTNKTVELVLDPTLLHDEKYWNKKADDSSLVLNKDYVFCYFLGLSDEKIKSANRFAKINNCEIITIPFLHNDNDNCTSLFEGQLLSNVNPADFLNLIRNSKYILTDSFHAVVFSIIFNKRFWCFSRDMDTYGMNTRLDTLLSYVNMNDRMISPKELLNKSVDYGNIYYDNKILNAKREHSINFLKKSLK